MGLARMTDAVETHSKTLVEHRRNKPHLWAQRNQCPLHTRTNRFTDTLVANDAIMITFLAIIARVRGVDCGVADY